MIARAGFRRVASTDAPWSVAALDQVLVGIECAKQRAQLAGLDSHQLHDLGLSRADIDVECRKHFWQR